MAHVSQAIPKMRPRFAGGARVAAEAAGCAGCRLRAHKHTHTTCSVCVCVCAHACICCCCCCCCCSDVCGAWQWRARPVRQHCCHQRRGGDAVCGRTHGRSHVCAGALLRRLLLLLLLSPLLLPLLLLASALMTDTFLPLAAACAAVCCCSRAGCHCWGYWHQVWRGHAARRGGVWCGRVVRAAGFCAGQGEPWRVRTPCLWRARAHLLRRSCCSGHRVLPCLSLLTTHDACCART
jgi:hypothetical protein